MNVSQIIRIYQESRKQTLSSDEAIVLALAKILKPGAPINAAPEQPAVLIRDGSLPMDGGDHLRYINWHREQVTQHRDALIQMGLDPETGKPLSKIAAGHNPGNLTEEQIGAANGYRLRDLGEHCVIGDQISNPTHPYWGLLLDPALFANKDVIIRTTIPKSKIAAGHNPHNLTEHDVGVSEGWRLRDLMEVMQPGDEINGKRVSPPRWERTVEAEHHRHFDNTRVTIRTKDPLPLTAIHRMDENPDTQTPIQATPDTP